MFCLDVSTHPKSRTCHGRFVLVNPQIVAASRNEKAREGCMSVPDFTGDVKRATRLTVTGQLPATGEPVTITTDAFEARALQHEIDHLNGKVFVEYLSPLKRNRIKTKLAKARREAARQTDVAA